MTVEVQEITLAPVTYVISDANGVVYTSDPVDAEVGSTITTLPNSLQLGYCNYTVTSTVVVSEGCNVPVTVEYDLPFTVSTSFDGAVWYYATIRNTKYLRADDADKDDSGRYKTSATNEKTDAYKWAFFGNPYDGFYIANMGQGAGKYLYASDVPTMQTVDDPSTTTAALWALSANGDGFTLRSLTGSTMYINDAEGAGNLGYWDSSWGATDAGSKWKVEEVPAAEVEVTYNVVVDGKIVATKSELQAVGGTPAVPASLNFAYTTYTYDVTEITGSTTTVTATPEFNLPFIVSTSIDDATWYYAKLRGHNVYYSKDNDDVRTNQTSLDPSDDYKWAFMGNPYEGIKVVNKTTKTYLDNTDGNVKLSEAGYAWTIHEKDANTFGLYNGSNYINEQNHSNHNLIYYWNFSGDKGSQWTVEEASAVDKKLLEDAIATASALCSNGGKLGYITSEAAATLSEELSAAQGVYADPAGDYAAAAKSLAAAAVSAERDFTPRTDKYYTITSARGSMVYDSSHDESADADGNNFLWYTNELDNTDVNHLWGFIEKEGKYYMYNVGKKQFATVSTSGSYQSNDKGTWVFSDTPAYVTFDAGIENSVTMPNVRVRATIATTKETYSMSISTGYVGPVITYDAKGDGGIPMLLAESEVAVDNDITAAMTAKVEDVTPYRNALKEVIDGCKDVVIGTAIGRFTSKDNTFEAAMEAANSAYNNTSATRDELQTAASNLKAAAEGLTLNVPAAGLYRVMNAASEGYLRATEVTGELGDKQAVFADEPNGNGANVIISLVEKDGKLYLCNQGYYFGWIDANGVSGSKGYGNLTNNADKYVNWMPGTKDGQIAFSICYGNGTGAYASHLTRGIYTVDASNEMLPVIAGTDYTEDAAQWIFEPVADAPEITISLHNGGDGVYYGTFCAPFDIDVVDFTEAYTLTLDADGVTLNLSDVMTDVPAGTPVLLVNSEKDETDAKIGDNYKVGAPSAETALTGSYLKTAITENDYVLGTDKKKVGFFHWEGTELAANHAYIKGNAEVKGYYLNLGETDGIENMRNGENETMSSIFNLNGQRISKAQKGIYIVNGKKTVIK